MNDHTPAASASLGSPSAWQMARRWGLLLLLAALVGGAIAYWLTGTLTPTYRATATLLVAQQQEEGVLQRADLETSALLAGTLADLVTVRPVLEQAAADQRLPSDAGAIAEAVEVAQDGQLITITASDEDPGTARDIANVLAQTFVASPEAARSSGGGATPAVSIVDPARAPTAPEAPNRLLNAMLGAGLAFALCLGLVALYEFLDQAITRPQEVTDLIGLPTLARLPADRAAARPAEYLALARGPDTPLAEEYRTARTVLRHVLLPQADEGPSRRVVVFTSATEGEGKTSVVANLAVAFGLAGYRALVLDADLRRPAMHQVFGVDNREGLTTLLTADRPADWVVQPTAHPGVSVITSGPLSLVRTAGSSASAADLLGSPELRAVVADVRRQFDVVLVDTPPALEASDAAAVAEVSDAVVLVLRAGHTGASELCETVERLAPSGAPLVGVILNRVRASHRARAHAPAGAAMVSLPSAQREPRRPAVQPATVEDPRSRT